MLSVLDSNPDLTNTTICENTPVNVEGPYEDLGGNTVCNGACDADVNGDNFVNVDDLLAVIGAWGNAGGPEDINQDGMVNVDDILAIIGAWGACP